MYSGVGVVGVQLIKYSLDVMREYGRHGEPVEGLSVCHEAEEMRKNENESKNEKHGDKSECVYDNVKIKIESTKVVNTRLVCSVQVRGCCSAYM